MGGGRGQWCCSVGPGGPSKARGTEKAGCERWGLETRLISSLTVYLDGNKEDVGLQNQTAALEGGGLQLLFFVNVQKKTTAVSKSEYLKTSMFMVLLICIKYRTSNFY